MQIRITSTGLWLIIGWLSSAAVLAAGNAADFDAGKQKARLELIRRVTDAKVPQRDEAFRGRIISLIANDEIPFSEEEALAPFQAPYPTDQEGRRSINVRRTLSMAVWQFKNRQKPTAILDFFDKLPQNSYENFFIFLTTFNQDRPDPRYAHIAIAVMEDAIHKFETNGPSTNAPAPIMFRMTADILGMQVRYLKSLNDDATILPQLTTLIRNKVSNADLAYELLKATVAQFGSQAKQFVDWYIHHRSLSEAQITALQSMESEGQSKPKSKEPDIQGGGSAIERRNDAGAAQHPGLPPERVQTAQTLAPTQPTNGYELSGKIHYYRYYDVDGTTQEGDESFHVFVRDCFWRIDTLWARHAPFIKTSCSVGSQNDGQIYQGCYYTNSQSASAILNLRNYPIDCVDEWISDLWLAFAAHCYSQRAKNALIPPVFFPSPVFWREDDLKEKVDLELMPGSSIFPMRMVFLHDGFWVNKNSNGKLVYNRMSPPFQGGFTNAFYEVTASTNVQGMVFPVKFSLTVFIPDPSGGNTLMTYKLLTGIVEDARASCSIDYFLPEMPPRSIVTDARLQDRAPDAPLIGWPITNQSWLTLRQAEAIVERQRSLSRERVRAIWLVVFAAVLCGVPILVLVKRIYSTRV